MDEMEKVKLADKKRQEIARRIKARLDRQRRQELERLRMINVFSIVSSLGMMTVIDFLLAYWGGDWLDNYFQTGDHTWRQILLGIAGLTFALGIFKLVYLTKPMNDEPPQEQTDNEDNIQKGNGTSN